jgi:mannose-1-phosphate guanylyltransferase
VLNGSVAEARTGEIFTMHRGDRHEIRAFTAMKLIEIRTLEEQDEDHDRIYDS